MNISLPSDAAADAVRSNVRGTVQSTGAAATNSTPNATGDRIHRPDGRVQTQPFSTHRDLAAHAARQQQRTQRRRAALRKCGGVTCCALLTSAAALVPMAVLFAVFGLPALSEHYGWPGSQKAYDQSHGDEQIAVVVPVQTGGNGSPSRTVTTTRYVPSSSSSAGRSSASSGGARGGGGGSSRGRRLLEPAIGASAELSQARMQAAFDQQRAAAALPTRVRVPKKHFSGRAGRV